MAKIVLIFRRMFCKHDFIIEEQITHLTFFGQPAGREVMVYMRCKKCGYYEKHKKF